MGTRYYAATWHPDDIDLVLADPRRALPDDPFWEVWSRLPDEHPDLLYLDKLWSQFQRLTASDDGTPRPCSRLFKGHVCHVEHGWIPWCRAILPAEVREIASDLAAVTDDDITTRFGPADTISDHFNGVGRRDLSAFLDRATAFTTRAAADGRGIAYLIG